MQARDGAQPGDPDRDAGDNDDDDDDDDDADDDAPGPSSTAGRRGEALRGAATAAIVRPSKQVREANAPPLLPSVTSGPVEPSLAAVTSI